VVIGGEYRTATPGGRPAYVTPAAGPEGEERTNEPPTADRLTASPSPRERGKGIEGMMAPGPGRGARSRERTERDAGLLRPLRGGPDRGLRSAARNLSRRAAFVAFRRAACRSNARIPQFGSRVRSVRREDAPSGGRRVWSWWR